MFIGHLCITYAHLLAALSKCLECSEYSHTIFMPIDFQYVHPKIRKSLKESFPHIRFVFVKESTFIRSFSRGRDFLPSIVNRNLSFSKGYFVRPKLWQRANYFDVEYERCYVYHSGPFLAKVLAGQSRKTILRVDGFASYQYQSVQPLKGVLRLMFGLSPKRQIWGEEKWIDVVEAPHPEMIPCSNIRQKAQQTFDVFKYLHDDTVRGKLMDCFGVAESCYAQAHTQVLLLTQPISEAGLCDAEFKQTLYTRLIELMHSKGFDVILKRHPREQQMIVLNCTELPLDFPVELLYFLGIKFKVALALNTAALNPETPLAVQQVQLIPLDKFSCQCTYMWHDLIAKNLESIN
ncbi:polysialyltransferase family glycosyltransferase [Vibrio maritimus]